MSIKTITVSVTVPLRDYATLEDILLPHDGWKFDILDIAPAAPAPVKHNVTTEDRSRIRNYYRLYRGTADSIREALDLPYSNSTINGIVKDLREDQKRADEAKLKQVKL